MAADDGPPQGADQAAAAAAVQQDAAAAAVQQAAAAAAIQQAAAAGAEQQAAAAAAVQQAAAAAAAQQAAAAVAVQQAAAQHAAAAAAAQQAAAAAAALQQGGGLFDGGQGLLGQPPQIPPMAPHFALVPGADYSTILDYTTATGRKTYENATAPLDPKYDGTPSGLRGFMSSVENKAKMHGWDLHLFRISVAGTHVVKDLLVEHGQITLNDVRVQATQYIGQPTRKAQAAAHLQAFLSESLKDDILLQVKDRRGEYTVNGVEDGPTMLKLLLSIVSINTRATVACLHAEMQALPAKLDEYESNITKFNTHVKSIMVQLRANGETTHPETLNTLFTTYKTADDEVFAKYILDLEARWEDGTTDVTIDELMNIADNKYKTMVLKKVWKAPTKEGEKLIALTAAYETLVKQNKGQEDPSGQPNAGKRGSGRASEWGWKLIAPTGTQPKTKTFKGKDYIYCPNHPKTKWVTAEGHKDGCNLDPKKKVKTAGAPKAKGATKADLKYARALMTVMDKDESEDEGDVDEENL
jgi:hypothetical protein